MAKTAGFIEYDRINPSHRPVVERIHDYREFVDLLPEEEIRRQVARCMDCGVPYCHSIGCPLGNIIPDWNDLVYRGKWQKAYERLELTDNFPEFTGRICPAPCEAACTLAVNDNAVSIRNIELAIIERAFREGWIVPHSPSLETGKRVAVIGSGPAGLAAAQQLRRTGHSVVVYEKSDAIGGILRYGIPDFKLEKRVLDRRLDLMQQEGVLFKTGVNVGTNISPGDLKKEFDATILALGAGQPRDLNVPGRDLQGIHFAMDYLTQSNQYVAGMRKMDEIIRADQKNVLVIGGGDTGSDCVGTAIRQEAKKVYQFEILPKPVEWGASYNPDWPDWPKFLKSSSSHEEGCERSWSIGTRNFSGKDGKITSGHFYHLEWKEKPGQQPEVADVPGSEFSLDVDLVLLAMGFLHVEHNGIVKSLGIDVDQRGNIRTDGNYSTSVLGVFAAGDAVTGASLVVRAIWHGREAAKACNNYLLRQKK
jgi:glutamate synthase (NADPH/NADH) small chain